MNAAQRDQIRRQLLNHSRSIKYQRVALSAGLQLSLETSPQVTRVMSSKLLARWIYGMPDLCEGSHAIDVGTGTGLQAIAMHLAGAEQVVCIDINSASVALASRNIRRCAPNRRTAFITGDLLESVDSHSASLILFAHPYFSGAALPDSPESAGMLAPRTLQRRFYAEAHRVLESGGRVGTMHWTFAGSGQDPLRPAIEAGFTIERHERCSLQHGIQRGTFDKYLFRRR